MAALQKIRSSSWILILMGVGMFLFILTMVLDSNTISALTNSSRNVGEVYGKSLSAEEFTEMVNEASEVMKLRNGGTLTDEQTDMVRNQVWNDYVQYELVKHECDKLGVKVTEKDVQGAKVVLQVVNRKAMNFRSRTSLSRRKSFLKRS